MLPQEGPQADAACCPQEALAALLSQSTMDLSMMAMLSTLPQPQAALGRGSFPAQCAQVLHLKPASAQVWRLWDSPPASLELCVVIVWHSLAWQLVGSCAML